MQVVKTPATPQSPVEDLGDLAQDALDTARNSGRSAVCNAPAEAGFGQTTRGAIGLTDDSAAAGPGPIVLQRELRTVAGS